MQHQDLSRAQLLDAAEEIFGDKGFHETTLKEVAELAEFSVGSVYSFFENKDDLFRQVFVRRGEDFMPLMRQLLAEKRKPTQSLLALVDFQVRWFRDHQHFGRLYLRYSGSIAGDVERQVDRAIAANFDEAMELQADLFRRGQEAKEFRPGDPEVLARVFSAMIGAYQALDPAVISDDPELPERLPLPDFQEMVVNAFSLQRRTG